MITYQDHDVTIRISTDNLLLNTLRRSVATVTVEFAHGGWSAAQANGAAENKILLNLLSQFQYDRFAEAIKIAEMKNRLLE